MFTFLLGLIAVMTQISVACCKAGVVTGRWDTALNVYRREEGYSGNATEKQQQATHTNLPHIRWFRSA